MKYFSSLRIACYLLLLFALGHTAGGLFSHQDAGMASELVWKGMQDVHFQFQGADCTYYNFWLGFGLTVTVFLLLAAYLAWVLGGKPREQLKQYDFVLWALCVALGLNTYLAWRYFFLGPTVLSGLVTLIFGWNALKART